MIGSTLKHYRIIDKLGQGGMAAVYRADDTRLGRQVALKVLPADLATDPKRIARFEREAKAIAALNHPNIVTIYSVEEADGVHFLTMELVDGQSFAGIIPEEGLEPPRFFELARPLLAAVAAAHRRGIVHRDIKPANVMVNSEGVVKLLDLGLAKLTTAAARVESSDRTLTAEAQVIGTVPYMAPEQLTGGPLDHRIDIYALGVLFHEMLTGRQPFRGDSTAELISTILRDPPPPLADVRQRLPQGLDETVARCLEKQPHDRYQTVGELRDAINAAAASVETATLHTQPVGRAASQSSGVDTEPIAAPPLRSKWRPLAVVVSLTLVVALAAILLYRRPNPTPTPPPLHLGLALLPLEEVGDPTHPDLASGLAQQLRETLGSVDDLDLVEMPEDVGEEASVESADTDYLLVSVVEWHGAPEDQWARLRFEMIRDADGAVIWSESFERPKISTRMDRSAIAATVRSRIGELLGLPTPPPPRLETLAGPDATTRQASGEPASPRGPPAPVAGVEGRPGGPSPVEPSHDQEVAPALAPSDIELALDLVSNLSEGVITVYADDRQVYKRAFEFTERKGGVLGRIGVKKKTGGELTDGMLVPADVSAMRAYVALSGEPARRFPLAPSLRGDGTDRLVIEIRKKGEIEVRLE